MKRVLYGPVHLVFIVFASLAMQSCSDTPAPTGTAEPARTAQRPAKPATATPDKLTNIDTSLLPTANEVYAWHVMKDEGGGTFSGSPSWIRFMTIVETGLEEHGLVDVVKDRFGYRRWYTSDDPEDKRWSLRINNEDIRVASYWAYSGETDEHGVTAPLVVYDKDNPPESLEGKIVVFQVPGLDERSRSMFSKPGYEFGTDTETLGTHQLLSSNQ